MCTSQVRDLNLKTKLKVRVVKPNRLPQWSEVFENNPRIARPDERGTCVALVNAGGARPYIAGKSATHWIWKRWDIKPGEIFLSAAEKQFAEPHAGAILIEPHTKIEGGNKAWIWERWQELVDRGGRFIQVGKPGTRQLNGIEFVETQSFRHAMAVLSVSQAFVGPEGALHHAAAALRVPAVVLWSEFIAPEFTGYSTQRNLRHAGPACGSRVPCEGCKASMDKITVDEVWGALMQTLETKGGLSGATSPAG